MKRVIICAVIFILLVTGVFAVPNIEIEKIEKGNVIIAQLNNPAKFDFMINNKGSSDSFQIYSLLGVSLSPRGNFILPSGKSKIEVVAFPNEDVKKNRGLFFFDYEIKGENTGIFRDKLSLEIVDIDDVFNVFADNIKPGDKEVNITIENKKNANLENVNVMFKSVFFKFSEKVSLGPFGSESFIVPLDNERIKKLRAGPYVITADIEIEGEKTKFEGFVNYLEREGVAVNKESSGILIRKNIFTKSNVGNIPKVISIESKRDVLTRLFTGYSIAPENSERGAVFVSYNWTKELQPGDSFSVVSTTNYTFPFILAILVILIGFMAKSYSSKPVILNKRVSYVKTKSGDFALKVTLRAKAKKSVEDLELIDRLPATTKLYERFGKKPDKVEGRNIHWILGSMNSGEERVISYIIYSKIKIVGKFELPSAISKFKVNDEKESVHSNKTYFIADSVSLEE